MTSLRLSKLTLFGAVAASAIGLGGCSVHAQPEPVVGYAEVTSVPVDVEARPYVIYQGRPTYYVNERWVYRDRGRWVQYRNEPVELRRQRSYVQQPPRAPSYRPNATPESRPIEAPPAERVR